MNQVLRTLFDLSVLLFYWLEGMVLFFVPKSLRYKKVDSDVVLITGGGSGLGRLLAVRFAKLGAKVVVWDLYQSGLDETCRLVKQVAKEPAHSYVCDVSDRSAVYDTANRVRQEVGTVTILVNNAGIVSGKRFLETPDEKIIKTFEVNAISHFWTLKAFLPEMLSGSRNPGQKGYGHLVSIASIAGLSGTVRLADYCASKFAAVGLEESLRLELQCDGYNGIHSTVVCPFFINTGMFAGVDSSIIPILEPEYVADQIIAAVLTNQEVLVIPKAFYLLLALKALLPRKSSNAAQALLNTDTSMAHFIGHPRCPAPDVIQANSPSLKRSDSDTFGGRKLF